MTSNDTMSESGESQSDTDRTAGVVAVEATAAHATAAAEDTSEPGTGDATAAPDAGAALAAEAPTATRADSEAAEAARADTEAADEEPVEPLVLEGDIAADYLERLLDIVDFDGDIDLDVENGRAVVAILGPDLDDLVGARGETLDALQELTRLAVQQGTGNRSRLMLDVGGHRAARREKLTRTAQETAAEVIESGEPARMAAMNPFDRKVIHDAITAMDGVHSESEGEEPRRRVVVFPGD